MAAVDGGEGGGGAGDGGGVCERVLAAAGVFADSLCGGAGWEFLSRVWTAACEGVSACVAAGAGGGAVGCCFFSLADVIAALVVLRILVQFLMQHVGVIWLRRTRPEMARPFRMWLYPLPAVLAICGFVYILVERGEFYAGAGGGWRW